MFSSGRTRKQRIKNETIALHFAQEGIEQLLADKYLNGYDYLREENYPVEQFNGFQRRTYIYVMNTDIKKIVTVVNWANRSDSLVTLIGNF